MQKDSTIVIVGKTDVQQILQDKETAILDLVRSAYIAHEEGKSSLPHSTFLRFPDHPRDRIIGLPAYLKDHDEIAGIKWVASFPGNTEQGIERASATITLNSLKTGRAYGFIEGSLVNAKRTAASAVLGAQALLEGRSPDTLGLVGCGPINFEILRFLRALFPKVSHVYLYDLNPDASARFAEMIHQEYPDIEVTISTSLEELAQHTTLISFATTAATPHIDDPSIFKKGSVLLHISLRDLGNDIILNSTNVVDDCDHVNREKTSIHLASQQTGNTNFVDAHIGELLKGTKSLPDNENVRIYSPFGLGILDIQLAHFIFSEAQRRSLGETIENFF